MMFLYTDTLLNFLVSDESGHICLVSDLRGKTSCLSPSDVRRFSSAILHQLRKFSSIPCFQRVFIMNEYWILSDTSVVSTAVIMFFPIFAPLTWLTLLADFQIIYWPCIIGINLAWSYIFIYCSITFVNIFKVVFHFYSWETLVYIFILCLSRIYKFIM